MPEDTLEELTQKFPAYKDISIPDTPEPEQNNASNGHTTNTAETLLIELPDSAPALDLVPVGKETKAIRKRAKRKKADAVAVSSPSVTKHDQMNAYLVEERCRHLCLSIFFHEQTTARSLGFTSAVNGEGKSFLSAISAQSLASDSSMPITLLECNWEHPDLHEYFGVAASPGLAEWMRGEASESDIRYQVSDNLTIIPAGQGRQDAVKLAQHLRQKDLLDTLHHADELLIVDLPPVITSAYGSLMAGLVDALVIVVRAKVTSETLIAETCTQLKHMPVRGMLLNQVESSLPRWLRRLL